MGKPITKMVKVPVRIEEPDETIRLVKYRALDRVMSEARFLGNLALRYYVALSLRDVAEQVEAATGVTSPVDTRIYNILKEQRKHLPAENMATLARNFAGKMFRNTNKDAWAGRKSLPTYRALFCPFRKQGTEIRETLVDGIRQFYIEPSGFGWAWLPDEELTELNKGAPLAIPRNQKKLVLVSKFSWKDTGAAEVVARIASGEYSLCDSQMQRRGKDLLLFLSYRFEPEQEDLDPERVCGVDLGVVIPAVCAINFGPQRSYLGDGADVWAARSKFRAARRRQQRRQGLYDKSRRWERSQKEDDWIQTYYHALTRGVIKFCLQHRCGTIHMEDLRALRHDDQDSEYRRLMWVPSKFHTMLENKAVEAGIRIVRMNPRNTSRRCSECGHIAAENRVSQKDFICLRCGDKTKPVNADYNAARNIALATGDVLEKGYQETPGA